MESKRNLPPSSTGAAAPARRIDSSSSMGSLGIGGVNRNPSAVPMNPETAPARLIPAGDTLPGTPLYDCVVYLFYCPTHDRIALSSPERNRIIWLPFLALEAGVTWAQAAQSGIAVFLGRRRASELALQDQGEGQAFVQVPPTSMQFVHLLHLQMPSSVSGRSVVRLAAFVKLLNGEGGGGGGGGGTSADQSTTSIGRQGGASKNNVVAQQSSPQNIQQGNSNNQLQCCQNTLLLNWQLTGDVLAENPSLIEGVWAPEVRQLLQLLITPSPLWMEELTVEGSLRLLASEHSSAYAPSDPKYLRGFLASCSVTSETLLAVYEDFIEHLYPAVLMGMEALRAYLLKYGYPKAKNAADGIRFFTHLLNGFAYKRRGGPGGPASGPGPASYIDFEEFLVGVVALEPATKNASEVRLRLLFRFYDADGDDLLNGEEVAHLVRDLNPKLATEAAIAEAVTKTVATVCGGSGGGKDFTYELFSKAVTGNKLRGTGNLCRSPKAVLPAILSNAKSRSMMLNSGEGSGDGGHGGHTTSSSSNSGSSSAKVTQRPKKTGRGVCTGCRATVPDYCLHTVHLDTAGMCQKPLQIKEVNQTTAASETVMTPMRYSAEVVFSINSLPRAFTDSIRDGAHQQNQQNQNQQQGATGNAAAATGSVGLLAGGQAEAEMMANHVGALVEHVGELLASEERLIRVNSPAIVVGDLAGSLPALLALERVFWPAMPVVTNSIVFTGNYLSSGGGGSSSSKSNVEVLCYLLAFKAMAPNRVFLLRGANETREANRRSLLEEAARKYGPEVGRVIWGRLNEALDRLPFAATVDESILVVHSGVPRAAASAGGSLLAKCAELHKSIGNVQRESPLAYELISNVPTDVEQSTSERIVADPAAAAGHDGHHRRKVSPKANATAGAAGNAAAEMATVSGGQTFNATHFAAFLKANDLSHVIRGHDQPPAGYRFHFEGRCITISAASPSSAVVVATVDGSSETIRLVKVLLEHQPQQQHQQQQQPQRQAEGSPEG